MKYWLDTEFIEDGKTIDLLSIAIVAEDGRELYCEVDQRDVDYEKAGQWVKDNVIAHLWSRQKNKSEFNRWIRDGGHGGLLRLAEIKREILLFCGQQKPEFWAYYADYDWVVLCQLFGRMMDLPKGWPMYCRDLKQLCDSLGNPQLPDHEFEHIALYDARWVRDQYWALMTKAQPSNGGVHSAGMPTRLPPETEKAIREVIFRKGRPFVEEGRLLLAEIDALRIELAEAQAHNRRSICVYCGEVQQLSDPAKLRDEMALHIAACPKHPMNRIVEVMTAAETAIKVTADCPHCFDAGTTLNWAISNLGEKPAT